MTLSKSSSKSMKILTEAMLTFLSIHTYGTESSSHQIGSLLNHRDLLFLWKRQKNLQNRQICLSALYPLIPGLAFERLTSLHFDLSQTDQAVQAGLSIRRARSLQRLSISGTRKQSRRYNGDLLLLLLEKSYLHIPSGDQIAPHLTAIHLQDIGFDGSLAAVQQLLLRSSLQEAHFERCDGLSKVLLSIRDNPAIRLLSMYACWMSSKLNREATPIYIERTSRVYGSLKELHICGTSFGEDISAAIESWTSGLEIMDVEQPIALDPPLFKNCLLNAIGNASRVQYLCLGLPQILLNLDTLEPILARSRPSLLSAWSSANNGADNLKIAPQTQIIVLRLGSCS